MDRSLAAARLVATLALALVVVAPPNPASAQERKAYFDAPVVVTHAESRLEVLLDYDGDGDVDALGTWQTAARNRILHSYRNDGAGALAEQAPSTDLGDESATRWTRIVTGRLDADAIVDYAVNVASRVTLFLGSASGRPIYAEVVLPAEVTNFALADFDGNGFDDLVVAYAGFAAAYLNDGLGGFSFASLVQPWSATDVPQLFVTEVDGDGLADVGAVVTTASSTVILWSMAGGVFALHDTEFLPGVTDPMPASGDVDGDGDEDIVVFRMATYVTLRRDGPASFTVEPEVIGGPATKLADVDGDGDLDGICCGGGGGETAPQNTSPSIFHISINDGAGGFAPAFQMPGLGSQRVAGAADLDADGDVDLVAGRCVYYSPGAIADPYARVPDPGPTPDHVLPLLDGDRDGDVDAQFSYPSCRVNLADGTFEIDAAATTSAPPGGRLVGPGLPGDFDGDGDADLIVRHESAATGVFVSMRLLVNRGAGRLWDGGDASAISMFEAAHRRTAHVVADIDADGDSDVVANVIRFETGPATTWRNDGTGAFTSYQTFPNETVLAVEDFDGDGAADAVTQLRDPALPDPFRLLLRFGVGSGWFGDPVVLLDDDYRIATRLVVEDFDRDGDVDIVTDEPRFRILVNDGSGGFGDVVDLPGLADGRFIGENSLILTDVDGDGWKDILFSSENLFAGLSSIYLQGPRGFEYAAQQVFMAVAAADVDGDGDEDLLSDEYTRGTGVDAPHYEADHFIRSRRFERPASGSKKQYGTGLPGSDGITPIIGAASPFRPGEPREYRIVGGLGAARAFLAVGLEEASRPHDGGTLLVDPIKVKRIRLGGAAGVPGAGSWTLSSGPAPQRFAGRTYFLQAAAIDPGAVEGVSLSNGLRVTFGD